MEMVRTGAGKVGKGVREERELPWVEKKEERGVRGS